MEGAGASIVSDAAEHATRGMDSVYENPETSNVSETDEEPELPSGVQDLIRLLEGICYFLPDLGKPEFREFFPDRVALSTITGWRSQVRLRVLEAIGNCNTFEVLNVWDICGGEISRLTASEWKIVFRGFMSSTNLGTIEVGYIEWSSDEEVESLCLQLGGVLNSSSVKNLCIQNCSLSARCWLNLASGLRGNCESKLKRLHLEYAWEYSSAVKHVADMINSAPLLQTLRLCVRSKMLCFRGSSKMDDEAVGMLSQALIQSSSLKDLRLENVKWGAVLLLKALAGDDGNRSIERILLGKKKKYTSLATQLRQLFPSKPPLKEVELDNLRMRPEYWHQLGKVICDKAIAKRIGVVFSLKNDEHEWKSIEALACAASSDVKDPILKLHLLPESDHDYVLSLNLLGRVLRGEIQSLKSFHISYDDMWKDSNEDGLESILSMNGNT